MQQILQFPTHKSHRAKRRKAPKRTSSSKLQKTSQRLFEVLLPLRHVKPSQPGRPLSFHFCSLSFRGVEKRGTKLPNPSQLKKMSGTGPSAAGLRRRTAGGASSKGRSSSAAAPGSQGGTAGSFSVRLYNDSAPGFKVGPFFVVMSSIVYLVVVVMLHMWGRVFAK